MLKSLVRRALALGAACLALSLAPLAHADPVFHTIGYAAGSQQFGVTGGTVNAGAFKGTWDGDPIVFWCVQLDEYFSFGQDYTYTASLPDNAKFTLLGKLFHLGYSLSDAAHSAAFQLAIWEIFFDTGLNLSAGGFQVLDNKGHGYAVTLAQQLLNGIAGSTDDVNVYHLFNGVHQDFVTGDRVKVPDLKILPEPSSMLLVVLALGAAMIAARSRRGRSTRSPADR